MVEAARDLFAFTDAQARKLAGVSLRRLRYWEQVGLVVPSIKRELSPITLSACTTSRICWRCLW